MSGVGRTSCELCQSVYTQKGRIPPCTTCKPSLMDVNGPFFVLYSYVSDQRRTGPTGAEALDMLAINQGMDDYNVDKDERILFSTKVRQIANIIIALRRAEEEQKINKQGSG